MILNLFSTPAQSHFITDRQTSAWSVVSRSKAEQFYKHRNALTSRQTGQSISGSFGKDNSSRPPCLIQEAGRSQSVRDNVIHQCLDCFREFSCLQERPVPFHDRLFHHSKAHFMLSHCATLHSDQQSDSDFTYSFTVSLLNAMNQSATNYVFHTGFTTVAQSVVSREAKNIILSQALWIELAVCQNTAWQGWE